MDNKKTVEIVLKTTLDDKGGGVTKIVDGLLAIKQAVIDLDTQFTKANKVYTKYRGYIHRTTNALVKLKEAQNAVNTSTSPKSTTASSNAHKQLEANVAKLKKTLQFHDAHVIAQKKQTAATVLAVEKQQLAISREIHKAHTRILVDETKIYGARILSTTRARALAEVEDSIRTTRKQYTIAQAHHKAIIEDRARTVRKLEALGTTILAINKRSGKYKEERKTSSELRKQTEHLSKLEAYHSTISSHVFGIVIGYRAANYALNVMVNTLKSIPAVLIELQTTQAVFAATFGSDIGAAGAFKALGQEAERTGIQITTLRETFRNLHASMSLAGETTKSTWNTFTSLNTVITSLHLTADKASNVFLAIAQIFNKNKVQSEELTKQLGNLLPGAFASFAKSMGISAQQLSIDMQKGLVQAHDNVERFAVYLATRFEESFIIAQAGLQANIGRLSTSFTILGETIGTAIEEPMLRIVKALTSVVKGITEVIKTTDILANTIEIAKTVFAVGFVSGLLSVGARLLGFVSILDTATGMMVKTRVAAALLTRTLAFLMSPATWILAGVALGTYFSLHKTEVEKAITRSQKLTEAIAEARVEREKIPVPQIEIDIENDPAVIKAKAVSKELLRIYNARALALRYLEATATGDTDHLERLLNSIHSANSNSILSLLSYVLPKGRLQQIKEELAALDKELEVAQNREAETLKIAREKIELTNAAEKAEKSIELSRDLRTLNAKNKAKAALAFNKFMFKENLISIKDFYSEKRRLTDEGADTEIKRLQSERASALDIAATATTGNQSGANALLRANRLAVRIAQLKDDLAAKQVKITADELKGEEKLRASIITTGATRLAQQGKLVEAAQLRLELRDPVKERATIEALQGVQQALAKQQKENLDYRDRNIIAETRLAQAVRDTGIANQENATSTAVLAAKEDTYRISALEGLFARTQANYELLDIQNQIVLQAEASYDKTADENGNIIRSIKAMRAELEVFKLEANEVANAVRGNLTDSLGDSFKDFITGAKSAGEAMKDFALSVIDSLAQIASTELATSIIGGLFSFLGVGGALSSVASSSISAPVTSLVTTFPAGAAAITPDFASYRFAKGGIPDIGTAPASFPMGSLREGGKPEVILPLKRTSSGDLGVVSTSTGAGGGIVVQTLQVNVVEKEDSTTDEQANAISKAVDSQLRSMMRGEIQDSTREGNVLNPTAATGVF